jgi:hypothetical protein
LNDEELDKYIGFKGYEKYVYSNGESLEIERFSIDDVSKLLDIEIYPLDNFGVKDFFEYSGEIFYLLDDLLNDEIKNKIYDIFKTLGLKKDNKLFYDKYYDKFRYIDYSGENLNLLLFLIKMMENKIMDIFEESLLQRQNQLDSNIEIEKINYHLLFQVN